MAGDSALTTPPWKQGEDAALALRHTLRLGDGPVNIWQVIRGMGIVLAVWDFGPAGGDGRYINKASRPMIVINSGQRASRQRFTAAHELGHHELHRHDRDNLVVRDDNITAGGADPVEQAASAFAGAFLAPAAGLMNALGGKHGAAITPEDVVALMGEFGLSYEATVNRLAKSRINNQPIINQPQRQALLDQGAGNIEWLLDEAGIDETKLFPVKGPLPADYVDRVVKMWCNHFISDVRFAEMLRMDPEEAQAYRERRGLTRPARRPHDLAAARRLIEELS
ncbi:MAG: ImmA/IrrE family metallo-endopeptidase [Solirubrobacteraceae bacterium]